jgi:hypothetical protein
VVLALVRSWARKPGPLEGSQDWKWLRPWFRSVLSADRESIVLPLALTAGCAVILLRRHRQRPQNWDRFSGLGVGALLVSAIGAIVFWFLSAPNPRYILVPFWMLPAVVAVMLFKRLEVADAESAVDGTVARPALRRCILTTLLLVASISIFDRAFAYWRRLHMSPFDALAGTLLLPPGPDQGFHALPKVRLVSRQTRSQLAVWVPKRGDQVYDAPLPCTPHFNPALRLRRDGDLSAGFMVNHVDPTSQPR